MSAKGFMQSPLARVRGLGSAKDGTTHWWHQRLTAVALVPLVVLFVLVLLNLVGSDWATVYVVLANPFVATLTILLVVAAFWHLKLGLQVVIEDYVHDEWRKITLLLAVNGAIYVVGLLCVLAVLSMVMGD